MSIEFHANHIPLEQDAIIWRYMNLEKYLSLLEKQSLFFCRADKFSDPFEGSLLKREAEYRVRGIEKIIERKYNTEEAKSFIDDLSGTHKRFKRGIVINCWHINNNESDAMWRLYLKDNEGVAIQSTASRVFDTFDKIEEKIQLSKIRYLDYEKDAWFHPLEYPHRNYSLITPLIHKRREFIHEQEYRIYHQIEEAIDKEDYWDRQENHKGTFIKIDLNNLIQKIYFPPTVDQKTQDKIIRLTEKNGFSFEFKVSQLKNKPYY